MAQIAAADVTYAVIGGLDVASPGNPRVERGFTVSFGDGSLTYTNGGIPLTKAKLGCANVVTQLLIMDAGNTIGYVPKLDYTNLKIRLFQNDTAATLGPLIEVATSAAVTACILKVIVQGY
jgi:hypothetical protein